MAAKQVMTIIGTTGSKLSQLPIVNGQLIFVKDKQTIALDSNDKRTFYNQIVTIDTEDDRENYENAVNGLFYFVIDSAILYRFERNRWIKITTGSKTVVCIGIDFPELGSASSLYVSTAEKQISVWDENSNKFIVVADKTREATDDEIDFIFS